MRNIFRKVTGRPADSFDQVSKMETRKLEIPDLQDPKKFIQFVAKREKDGYWKITVHHNVKNVTAGFSMLPEAYQNATEKHFGKRVSKPSELSMNFDTAFLILKDLEEAILKYTGQSVTPETDRHFMAAYRLLPKQFQEGLDDLYHARNTGKPTMPDKTVIAAQKSANPAQKDDSSGKKPQGPKNPSAPN